MDKNYCVIVKTGDAELRAMQNLSEENLNKILPVVELTRGRARNIGTREEPRYAYPYDAKLKRLKEIFNGKQIALDVTSEESLSSQEIDKLFDCSDGYVNWIDLIRSLKKEGGRLIPAILMNYDDEKFEINLEKQILNLSAEFRELMYRGSLYNEASVDDVRLICKYLPLDCELLIVLDCGWIPPASYNDPANACLDIIKQLKGILTTIRYSIAVCATTFPNNVSEIGDDVSDTFDLREIDLYELIKEMHPEIVYGDYGSINPVRNDQIVMARGWIPRIDVALERQIYYYRDRKGSREYSDTYTSVAKRVVTDPRFPSLEGIWGICQIKNCALGDAPSSSPSYWISVRMNTHIVQQIHRLRL
ncbi:beta family protein [Porphyromonas loveana]|uniref:beta family protein n=1 Tax=Porphyromonas loveana TaxID=1884669 RepID=UPI00359F22BB